MTNTIENNKKRKRNLPRGILTETERKRLEKDSTTRQNAYNIKRKTLRTIMNDLPLIFKYGNFPIWEVGKPYYLECVKLYFNITKSIMMNERLERKIKRKVSNRMVWKKIIEEINGLTETSELN